MKTRTHLIIGLIEGVIYLFIVIPIMPQRVTLTNAIVMLVSLPILGFSMIHYIAYINSFKSSRNAICISFNQFRSFRHVAVSKYRMEYAMHACYKFHSKSEGVSDYDIYIYFKSCIDYFRYWIYRWCIKHYGDSKQGKELYNKYISAVNEDIENFNIEREKINTNDLV